MSWEELAGYLRDGMNGAYGVVVVVPKDTADFARYGLVGFRARDERAEKAPRNDEKGAQGEAKGHSPVHVHIVATEVEGNEHLEDCGVGRVTRC